MNDDFSGIDHIEPAPAVARDKNCRNVSHSVALDELPASRSPVPPRSASTG